MRCSSCLWKDYVSSFGYHLNRWEILRQPLLNRWNCRYRYRHCLHFTFRCLSFISIYPLVAPLVHFHPLLYFLYVPYFLHMSSFSVVLYYLQIIFLMYAYDLIFLYFCIGLRMLLGLGTSWFHAWLLFWFQKGLVDCLRFVIEEPFLWLRYLLLELSENIIIVLYLTPTSDFFEPLLIWARRLSLCRTKTDILVVFRLFRGQNLLTLSIFIIGFEW